MFGFIRPLKSKFSEDEEARFREVYCGLCNLIGKRYGKTARLILNYDLAYLALVLGAATGEKSETETARCISKPIKGRTYRKPDEALLLAADLSVILTYYKLLDTVSDEGFIKSLITRVMLIFFKPKYKKAAAFRPEYDKNVLAQLKKLSLIERGRRASLDEAADTFAVMLSSAALEAELSENNKRILVQFFYHLGRFIFIADACCDFKEDIIKKRYNPIVLRYDLKTADLPANARSELAFTMENSLSNAASAFELLELRSDRDVISDILYFGLRSVMLRVLNGGLKANKNDS